MCVRACVRACVCVCGGDFSGKRFNISTNKLKSGVFNDKKSVQTRMLRSVITKNLNWEILTKNLVTFKR